MSILCEDVFFEDSVVIEGEAKGLGFRLLGNSSDASGSWAGGEETISPDTVTSVVGVVGIGDLKSKARDGLLVESVERGWKVGLTGLLAGWNK